MSKDANGYTRYCRIKALLNVAGSLNLRCALPKTYERGIIACVCYGYDFLRGRFYLVQHKIRKVVVFKLDSHSSDYPITIPFTLP